MVWFVCKMHLRHMCTFVSENLTAKGLTLIATKINKYVDECKLLALIA